MTFEELFKLMSSAPLVILLIFLFPPLYALVLRLIHGKGRGGEKPWKYFYTVLVYLSCVPGMFITVITAYQLFVEGVNLIKLDLLVYFLPIISMVATLIMTKAQVDFREIPGFNRLSGLLLMLGGAFAAALIIDRLNFVVLFHGSILWLFGIAAALFILMKIGSARLLKRKNKDVREITDGRL